MAVSILDLTKLSTDLSTFAMLLHGAPGAGKTRLMGDLLSGTEGKRAFINIAGQDGLLSLISLELDGVIAATVDSYDDLADFVCNEGPFDALAVDSIRDVHRLAVAKITGGERILKMGRDENEYAEMSFAFERIINALKMQSKRFVTCSMSDRSTDQLTNSTKVTPDLPGRLAAGIAQYFDFVGYMSAQTNSFGKLSRTLSFQTKALQISKTAEIEILTKARVVSPVTADIVLKEGQSNWPTVSETLLAHMKAGVNTKKEKKSWD
jgi:hypothetical protein